MRSFLRWPLVRAVWRVSFGNFLNWVTGKYDRDIVRKLNAAALDGNYSEELWKQFTTKTAPELVDEWKKTHEERLAAKSEKPSVETKKAKDGSAPAKL